MNNLEQGNADFIIWTNDINWEILCHNTMCVMWELILKIFNWKKNWFSLTINFQIYFYEQIICLDFILVKFSRDLSLDERIKDIHPLMTRFADNIKLHRSREYLVTN